MEELYRKLYEAGEYTKSFENFVAQYGTPEKAQRLYSGLYEDGSYTKSMTEFVKQYGFDKPPMPQKKKENMGSPSVGEEEVILSDTQLPEETFKETFDIEGREVTKEEFDINQEREAYKGTLLDDAPVNQFEKSQKNITGELIERQEEFTVPKLNYEYSQYGFTFEEAGMGDSMDVTADNGETLNVNLDPWFGIGAKGEAEALKSFLAANKKETSLIRDSKLREQKSRKVESEKEILNTVKVFNAQTEAFQSEVNNFTALRTQLDLTYQTEFANVSAEQIAADPILKNNYNVWLGQQKRLQTTIKDLSTKEVRFKDQGRKIDLLAADYALMQGDQGGWLGGLRNAFLTGSARITASGAGAATDLLTGVVLPNAGMSEEAYIEEIERVSNKNKIELPENWKELDIDYLIETLGEDGEKIESEILDVARKATKYFESTESAIKGRFRNPYSQVGATMDTEIGLVDQVRLALPKLWGSDDTTEQWVDMKKEGFWGGSVLGLVESLPAMMGGAGAAGWVQRTVQMIAQVSDHVDEEMTNSPEFDNISESEKYVVKAPIAIAVGALESLGLRNIVAQKGLLNGVIKRAMLKSTEKTTAKTFGDFIKQDVENAFSRGLLTFTAYGAAEFETGFAQEFADLGIKQLYNNSKEKEMFKTPDTWDGWVGQMLYAGAQEAVGGFIMGVPGAISSGVTKQQLAGLPEGTFEMFEEMVKDPNYKTIYEAKLKSEVDAGTKTQKEADAESETFDIILGIEPRIPAYYTIEQKKEALELLYQKAGLKKIIDVSDPKLVTGKQKQLDEVNSKLENILATAQEASVENRTAEQSIPEMGSGVVETTTTKQGQVSPDGNVTNEEAMDIESFFGEEVEESVDKRRQNLSINRTGKTQVSPENKPIRDAIIKIADLGARSISKVLPQTRIILHESNDEYLKYATQGQGRGEFNPTNNVIHINLSEATKSTIPHEIFHAVFINKVKTDARAAQMAEVMVSSVRKTLSNDSELAKKIDEFASSYTGDQEQFQNEERLAELIGLLSSKEFGYSTLSKPAQNTVVEFFKKIAKRFGIELGSDFGKTDESVIDLINTIAKKTAEGEVITAEDVDFLDNGTNPIGSPTEIRTPKSRQNKISFKDSYENSLVTPDKKVDFDALIADIVAKKQKVWFWVADQLGINQQLGIDGGPSFPYQNENDIWASGMSVKGIQNNIDKTDYLFIISGSPSLSKLFNKSAYDFITSKLGDFSTFKEAALKTNPVKVIKETLENYNSWEDLRESTERKAFLIGLNKSQDTPNTKFTQYVQSINGYTDLNTLRDGFYLENDFKQNDIMLILKPTGVRAGSNHSTYENTVEGEVIGVPDIKVDALEVMPQEMADKYAGDKQRPKASQAIAPYGSGRRDVTTRQQKDENNNLSLQDDVQNKRGTVSSTEGGPKGLRPNSSGPTEQKSRFNVRRSDRVVGDDSIVESFALTNKEELSLLEAIPGRVVVDSEFYEVNDPELFYKQISESKKSNKYAASVFVYPVTEYAKSRLFLTPDGSAGLAITEDGDIISVFSYEKGKGRVPQLVVNAIKEGAVSLDHYDTILTDYYALFGFVPAAKVKWNNEYAPEEWNKETFFAFNKGEPDVVAMVYDGGDRNTIAERVGTFENVQGKLKEAPYVKEWDNAKALQSKLSESLNKVRQQKSVTDVVTEGRVNNFKDATIRDFLVRVKGYAAKEVDAALEVAIDLLTILPESFKNVKGGVNVGAKLFGRVSSFRTNLTEKNNKNTRLTESELNAKVKEFAAEQRKTYKTTEAITKEVKSYKEKLVEKNSKLKTPLPSSEVNKKVKVLKDKLVSERDSAREKVKESVAIYEAKQTLANNKKAILLSEQEIVDKTIEFLEAQPEYKNEADTYSVGSEKKGTKETKSRTGLSIQQASMLSDLQKSVGIRPTQDMASKIRMARLMLSQRKKGTRDLNKIKTELRNFIRKSLPKELYTKTEVMSMVRKITLANQDNIDNIYNEVIELATKKNVEALSKNINNILNDKFTQVQSGRLKGIKIDLAIKERIDSIKERLANSKMDAEEILNVNETLMKEFAELQKDPEQTSDTRSKMVDLQIIMEYNNSLLMDNTDINKVQSLDLVSTSLDELIEFGRTSLKEELAEAHAKYTRQFEYIYEDVVGESIDMSDKNAKEKLKKAKRVRGNKAQRKSVVGKTKYALNAIGDFITNKLFTTAEALDGLMDKISSLPGEMFGGRTQELVTERVDDSSRQFKKRRMIVETAIKNKLEGIYGKSWTKESRKARVVSATGIYIDIQEVNDAKKAYEANPNSQTKRNLEQAIIGNELILSQNQMYYLYNQFKDPSNHKAFENMYGEGYKNVMKEVESKLTKEIKEFADWQVEEFFPELYEGYNDVYKKIYRTNMPWNEHYAGRIYREGVEVDPLDLLAGISSIYNTSVGSASTKFRTQNALKIQAMDGTDALASYLNDMEYFAAFAETVRDINKLFTNEYISSAITDIHGETTMNLIKDVIQKIANKGQRNGLSDSLVNSMNSVFILSRLALSPVIAIKQLTSTFTYMDNIGFGNWLMYGAKNVTEVGKTWKEIRDNSVYMQDRKYDSILKNIESYSEKSMKEFIPNPVKEWAVNFMMYQIKWGDRTAIMLGGMPNYKYYKAQFKKSNPNATEQQVINYAIKKFETDTKRTQQSSDIQDKDVFQTGSPVVRALNMFMTTPKQYLRKEIQAVRSLNRKLIKWDKNAGKGSITDNVRTLMMYHIFMPVLFQYISAGLPGLLAPWEDEDEQDLMRAGIIGNLNALFITGEIIAGLGDYFTEKSWAGEGSKSLGVLNIASALIKKAKIAEVTKDPIKQAEKWNEFMLELVTVTGLPAPTLNKFFENYGMIGSDGDLGKDILRLLNYSKYQIEPSKSKVSTGTKVKSIYEQNEKYRKTQNKKEKESKQEQNNIPLYARPSKKEKVSKKDKDNIPFYARERK